MNGVILFVIFFVFGRYTIPLCIQLIIFVFKLLGGFFTASEASGRKNAKKRPMENTAGKNAETSSRPAQTVKPIELPQEQKVMACTAIIEDSFSYRDDFLDELYEGTEHPIFSVPNCLNCTEKQFEDQYGRWVQAWLEALTLSFDVSFSYLGRGCFAANNVK